MGNIEEIKSKAKAGDIESQIILAHAYLNGDGVTRNRAHYLNWLCKAGEQGSLEAQKELVEFHTNKRNKKFGDPVQARYWMRKAADNGADFTQEDLLKAGDSQAINEKVYDLLFNSNSKDNFEKAKDLILKNRPETEILGQWAEKYHEIHKNDKSKRGNIYYLYLLSCGPNGYNMNELAVDLINKNEKDNLWLSAALFQEASKKGNRYANASYFYCLLYGKGIKKDLNAAAEIYMQSKEKGEAFNRAFVSSSFEGRPIKLPNNKEWKRKLSKLKLEKKIGSFFSKIFSFIPTPSFQSLKIVSEYWNDMAIQSTFEEEEAIQKAISEGQTDADGCRDQGCTEGVIGTFATLSITLSIASIVLIGILGCCGVVIPKALLYFFLFITFFPNLHLIFVYKGNLSKCLFVLFIMAAIGYFLSTQGDNFTFNNLSFMNFVEGVLGLVTLVLMFAMLGTVLPLGAWWHYLKAFEYEKGFFIALLYAIISLGALIGGGWYLMQQGCLVF